MVFKYSDFYKRYDRVDGDNFVFIRRGFQVIKSLGIDRFKFYLFLNRYV